jgi:AcrR family transcriptional regulator
MGRPWSDTVEEHRRGVRDAVLDAAGALVTEHGLTGVSMSGLAERSGVGRATLYRYFPDLDAVLRAWHERQIAGHLKRLTAVRDRTPDPAQGLREVLATYAHLSRRHSGERDGGSDNGDHTTGPVSDGEAGGHPIGDVSRGQDLVAALHQSEHALRARQKLVTFLSDLVREAVAAGQVRSDVPPKELAQYCLAALGAADAQASGAAVKRLVAVTLEGLRPQPRASSPAQRAEK